MIVIDKNVLFKWFHFGKMVFRRQGAVYLQGQQEFKCARNFNNDLIQLRFYDQEFLLVSIRCFCENVNSHEKGFLTL